MQNNYFNQQNQQFHVPTQQKTITIGHRILVIQKLIGEGSYGKIFEVCDLNSKEAFVMKSQSSMTKEEQEFTMKMKERRFKNLVNVIEYYFDGRYHHILMEKCEGDMFNLYVEKKKITDESFRHIALEIARGIKELHDIGLVHRDIKPENIMIFKQVDKLTRHSQDLYKLGDFQLIKDNTVAQTLYQGTPYYLSPEQLGQSNNNYSYPVDIWAFGAVLYELCSQQVLFQGQIQEEIYQKIKNQEIEPFINRLAINQDYKNLILQMLNRDSSKRPTIDQIIKKLECCTINKALKIYNNSNQIKDSQYCIKSVDRCIQNMPKKSVNILRNNIPSKLIALSEQSVQLSVQNNFNSNQTKVQQEFKPQIPNQLGQDDNRSAHQPTDLKGQQAGQDNHSNQLQVNQLAPDNLLDKPKVQQESKNQGEQNRNLLNGGQPYITNQLGQDDNRSGRYPTDVKVQQAGQDNHSNQLQLNQLYQGQHQISNQQGRVAQKPIRQPTPMYIASTRQVNPFNQLQTSQSQKVNQQDNQTNQQQQNMYQKDQNVKQEGIHRTQLEFNQEQKQPQGKQGEIRKQPIKVLQLQQPSDCQALIDKYKKKDSPTKEPRLQTILHGSGDKPIENNQIIPVQSRHKNIQEKSNNFNLYRSPPIRLINK